jgi:imidazolonepropionase-like amidohydrolase
MYIQDISARDLVCLGQYSTNLLIKIMKTIVKGLLVSSALFATTQSIAQSASQSTATLYENVRVFDGTSEKLSAPTNVLVVNNLIKTISNKPITVPSGTTATVIAGGGRTLMPGLSDAHTHLWLTPTLDVLMQGNLKQLNDIAYATAKQMLLNGWTTVRDMAGPTAAMRDEIDAGKAIGPRIYPSGTMISQTSGHGDFSPPDALPRQIGGELSIGEKFRVSSVVNGRPEVLAATRFNLRNGSTQIKLATSGGVSSADDSPTVQEFTSDEIKAAVEAASDFGTYVAVHAYNSASVRRSVDAGVKSIEHGQLLDEATVKYLKNKDVWLSIQNFEEFHPPYTPYQIQKEHQVVMGQNNVFKWALQNNVKMAWGTDFFFQPDGVVQNIQLSKLNQWMTPARALKLATHDNAQLFAMSGPRNPYTAGKLGVVQEGAYADLLLVDGDPTQNLEIIADPDKNFRIIMKDGKIYKNTL